MSAHENEASRKPVTPVEHADVPATHGVPVPPNRDTPRPTDATSVTPHHDTPRPTDAPAVRPDAPASPSHVGAPTQAHDNATTLAHDAVVSPAKHDKAATPVHDPVGDATARNNAATPAQDAVMDPTAQNTAATSCLNRRGIQLRIAAVMICAGLVLAGTVSGNDDDFPFGPFRMYSTRDNPNGEVRELRVQVLTTSGQVLDVTNTAGAPRRAELEGRIGDLVARPAELAKLAPLYTARLHNMARALRLVWLVHPLHHGRSAATTTSVICSTSVSSP